MKEKLLPVGTLVRFRESMTKVVYAVVIKSEVDWRGKSDHDIYVGDSERISYGWSTDELVPIE